MKPVSAKTVKGLNVGSKMHTCDNSGAKIIKITSVKGHKTVKGRIPAAAVADFPVTSEVALFTWEASHPVLVSLFLTCSSPIFPIFFCT